MLKCKSVAGGSRVEPEVLTRWRCCDLFVAVGKPVTLVLGPKAPFEWCLNLLSVSRAADWYLK